MCHGKGLQVFSGAKNQGCLQGNTTEHGFYDPKESSVNFAVPDEKSFSKSCQDLPMEIKCGVKTAALKMLDPEKEYVISIDGKKIACGLGKDDNGDIDLWGLEEPSLQLCKERKEVDLNTVNVVEKKLNCALDAKELNHITKLLSTMMGYICDIRQTEMGHKAVLKHLLNLADNNPDSKGGCELGIGSVKASIFTTSEWIDRALQNN